MCVLHIRGAGTVSIKLHGWQILEDDVARELLRQLQEARDGR